MWNFKKKKKETKQKIGEGIQLIKETFFDYERDENRRPLNNVKQITQFYVTKVTYYSDNTKRVSGYPLSTGITNNSSLYHTEEEANMVFDFMVKNNGNDKNIEILKEYKIKL